MRSTNLYFLLGSGAGPSFRRPADLTRHCRTLAVMTNMLLWMGIHAEGHHTTYVAMRGTKRITHSTSTTIWSHYDHTHIMGNSTSLHDFKHDSNSMLRNLRDHTKITEPSLSVERGNPSPLILENHFISDDLKLFIILDIYHFRHHNSYNIRKPSRNNR